MLDHEMACDCAECLPLRTAIAAMWTEVDGLMGPGSSMASVDDGQVVMLLRKLAVERAERQLWQARCRDLEPRIAQLVSVLNKVFGYDVTAGERE